MSSSSDVRSRRPRIVSAAGAGLAVLPELSPSGVLDMTDAPAVDPTYERAFADGHAAAMADAVGAATAGARAAAARAEQVASSLADAVASVRQHAAAELDALASEVAEAALVLAEAIVGRVLGDEAPASAAMARAMALVPSGEPVVVRLHPDDVELVAMPLTSQVTVVADPAVRPGGCLVASGASTIDGGLAAAVDRARAALLGDEDQPW